MSGFMAPRSWGTPTRGASRIRRVAFGQPTTGGAMAEFPGIAHVAVTVSDLGRSTPWYQELFGAKPVLDEDTGQFHHVVWLIGGQTLFGIHEHPKLESREPASELR